MTDKYRNFTKSLLQWNRESNNRSMPWKGEKDPYKVWLSEVILQQTRVEQGLAYYYRFIKKYPDIFELAGANDEEVFKLWEGLGYYSRCKNLLGTARFIVDKYDGRFPDKYEEISALKGIGHYTAAAISSFCFKLPYAVVDGNVLRVLSRIFNIAKPVDSRAGIVFFRKLADKLLDKKKPGVYNQAIMDFGATVCKPKPDCYNCSLHGICTAFEKCRVNHLPVKEKYLKKKTRWFSYFMLESKNGILIRKRIEKDIWQNLFEFYLVETDTDPVWKEHTIKKNLSDGADIWGIKISEIALAKPQTLTHQLIKGYFIHVKISSIPENLTLSGYEAVSYLKLNKFPFPSFINRFMEDKKAGQYFATS